MKRPALNTLTVFGFATMVLGGGLFGLADAPAQMGLGAALCGLAVAFIGMGSTRARAASQRT